MAAAKLQYSDRMVTSMRTSFVQLLDSNRQSFRGQVASKNTDQLHTTFDNLKKTAMALTTQKVEAPAPHEKIVVGGKEQENSCIIIHPHTNSYNAVLGFPPAVLRLAFMGGWVVFDMQWLQCGWLSFPHYHSLTSAWIIGNWLLESWRILIHCFSTGRLLLQ